MLISYQHAKVFCPLLIISGSDVYECAHIWIAAVCW